MFNIHKHGLILLLVWLLCNYIVLYILYYMVSSRSLEFDLLLTFFLSYFLQKVLMINRWAKSCKTHHAPTVMNQQQQNALLAMLQVIVWHRCISCAYDQWPLCQCQCQCQFQCWCIFSKAFWIVFGINKLNSYSSKQLKAVSVNVSDNVNISY